MATMTIAVFPGSELLTDEQIVGQVLAGRHELYELVVRRYNRRLYRSIRSIVRSESEVEEVMQQAYVQAYEHLAQFEGRATFGAWITRIAVYAAFAHVRRSKREPATGTDADELSSEEPESFAMSTQSPRGNPEAAASNQELRVALEESVDALPGHYRTVFVLRALEEMSVAETAEALGIQEETVKTRFFRARTLLRKSLLERADATASQAFGFHLSRCDRIVAAVFARLGLVRGGRSTRANH
jgi:RNA polymerase sigma-70 factor (ECF subfamily)